jgi:hypothetical protein
MLRICVLLGIWFALNAAFPVVMLNRRRRAQVRHRPFRHFRWVVIAPRPNRSRQLAHELINAAYRRR